MKKITLSFVPIGSLEYQSATELVKKSYAAEGYYQKDSPMDKQHLSAHTRVLVAHKDNVLIGTISVTKDTEGALPLVDIMFPEQMALLRSSGANLAHYGSLATDANYRSSCLVAFRMMGYLFSKQMLADTTHAVSVIHPKHAHFYEEIGFVALGKIKNMPNMENAPGVFIVMDIAQARMNPLFQKITGGK